MQVGFIEAADRDTYDAYVATRPESLFFHRFAWRDAVVAAYGETPCYLAARDDAGQLVGALPLFLAPGLLCGNRLISLPHAPSAGMLADDATTAAALTAAAVALARERCGGRMVWREPPERLPTPGCAGAATYRLPLPDDADALWRGLRSELRNRVRKAQKAGVGVDQGHELLPLFCRIYERHMLELGTPPHPPSFFEALVEAEPSRVDVSVATLNGEPVAGMIRTRHGNVTTAIWVSSLSRANAACPVNLLYWEALRTAVEQGVAVFDFGRGRPGAGPTIFKTRHGAVPHRLPGRVWPQDSPVSDNAESSLMTLAARVWRHLPACLATTIGHKARRYLP